MRVIAVTGSTGKSGQYFLSRLLECSSQLSDFCFRMICRGEDEMEDPGLAAVKQVVNCQSLRAEMVCADLTDQQTLDAAFAPYNGVPVDTLLHIAGVHFSRQVVAAALEAGVSRMIVVHTTGIYSKYKAAGEEYRQIETEINEMIEKQRASGKNITLTILRPTMIYGDLQDRNISTFIRMVDKLRLFPVVNGARYDLQPVWCKDLGDAYFDVLMNPKKTDGKEYILSGGAPILLRELLEEIARQLGVKNTYVSCPFPIAYFGAWVIYLLTFTKIDMREKVQRLVEPRAFSHEAATRDFGFDPVTFPVGVRDEIEMYRQQKEGK